MVEIWALVIIHKCIMHSNIGHEILRLQIMTGYDITSKIGTKYRALNAKPIDYLKNVWSKQTFMSRRSRESRVVPC